jgi:hypothetical protein
MKNVEELAHHNSRSRTQNVEVFMKNVEAPAHYNSRSRTILLQETPTPTPPPPLSPNLEIPTRSTNVSHLTSKTGCTSVKIF